MTDFTQVATRVLGGEAIGPDEAAPWLGKMTLAELGGLMAAAAQVREAFSGQTVELCAIINARSGRCSEDCAFCAQSVRYQTKAQVYPLLSADDMVGAAARAADDGAGRFSLVTSGRSCPDGPDLDEICRAGERLASQGRVLPCASLGLLTLVQARRLKDAGFVRYHHNLEAGPSHFPRICTSHAFQDRVDTIQTAREAGMEICVGGIVGLGESPWERAELAAAIARLEPESVPLNFLNPIPGTALGHLPRLSPLEALAAVAVFRLMIPRAWLRTCGGRQQVLARLAPLMYLAGCDATMIGDYLTTQGRSPDKDTADLAALGLTISNMESV